MVGGSTNEEVEMLINVNKGRRAEVMLIKTMETVGKGVRGYQRWRKNTHAELICSQNQGLRTE